MSIPSDSQNGEPAVVVDPTYGYRRLDPVPREAELSAFYESQYYELLRRGGRAPDLRHLLAGGAEAERERTWLRASLYADVLAMLEQHAPGRRLLDVGAGTGEFLAAAGEAGFDCSGIEPSEEAVAVAHERELNVTAADVASFVESRGDGPGFDAVVLLNVLEHVPDPALTLDRVRSLLGAGGVCFVRVPNDFNRLQLAAREKLGLPSWWIAAPDHVSYFDFESFGAFASELGFETIDLNTDFPMEIFLLMGIDYISDPSQGGLCHGYRVELELSLPAETRRELYGSLAEQGLGRHVHALLRPRP